MDAERLSEKRTPTMLLGMSDKLSKLDYDERVTTWTCGEMAQYGFLSLWEAKMLLLGCGYCSRSVVFGYPYQI